MALEIAVDTTIHHIMRNFLFALIALCLAPLVEVKAQALRFNARGEFKIVQFTDLHYRLDDPR